jgi:zinc transporter
MSELDGLINAFLFQPDGRAEQLDWDGVHSWQPDHGVIWVHLDRRVEKVRRWLHEDAGVDPIVAEALLAEETRPRMLKLGDSLLVILRGVNLNPGADPEDMISIRLWFEAGRIISLRGQRLLAVEDIRQSIAGVGKPQTPGELLPELAARLVDRMGPVIDEIDDQIDALEAEILEDQTADARTKLGAVRRRAIALRRYLSPQRDVLARLSAEMFSWLNDQHRARLREVADRVTRYVEDLDAARERAAVSQEELANRLSGQMNRTMYVLSLVAALFLPLGFITGLLGINVGGIPGTENRLAFATVCLIIAIIAVLQLWFFRRKKWF